MATDSSTDPKNPAENKQEKQDPAENSAKVPVKAVIEERNKRHAAEDKAGSAQEQLAKVQELLEKAAADRDGMMARFAEALSASHDAAFEKAMSKFREEVAPLKQEHVVATLRASHGLSQDQARAVLETQNKYPGMPLNEALVLAREANRAAFPEMPARSLVGDQMTGLKGPDSGSVESIVAAIKSEDPKTRADAWAKAISAAFR